MTTVPGIANAAVGLADDFQSRYLHKLLTMPVSIGAIMAGRLLADGVRLFIQGGAVLLLAVALGAQIETGFAGRAADPADRHAVRDRHVRRADREPRAQDQGPGRPFRRSSRWRSC